MFKKIASLEEMENIIQTDNFAFFYVTQPNCSVCHGLLPQIETILARYPMVNTYHVDASAVPEISGQYSLFSVPALLLFVDGKETLREARFVQTEKFEQSLQRIVQIFESRQ